MSIAITGATGQLGRIVVETLKSKVPPAEIVALVRSPNNAAELGVEVRAFDYSKPDTLAPALAGVDTLLFISSSEIGRRAEQHRNVIEAAREAGVRRIVYTSLLHADVSPLSLADEHRATEAALRASGVPHTILRNGWYTENYTGSIPTALAKGAYIGNAAEGRISSAARADYAEAAVTVLTSEGHEGRTYELAGDEAYTLTDLASELSLQSGRTIPYADLPEGDYAAALIDAGVPEPFARELAGWNTHASRGALFEDGRQLSGLLGRPTTPLSAILAEALR